MLKIEVLLQYNCLEKPRSQELFSDFLLSKAGVENSDLYIYCSRSKALSKHLPAATFLSLRCGRTYSVLVSPSSVLTSD